jgi:peptide deformylase
MKVREILLLGNPKLREISTPVADVHSRATQEIILDLAATLAEFRSRRGFGRAIAAPQIGVHQRILFVNMGKPQPLINPVITFASSEMMELWDDCFSFPDLMVRVRRHREISVTYLDEKGIRQSLSAAGDLSELLQHEIDHLDGILATDRAINARSLALRSELSQSAMPVIAL